MQSPWMQEYLVPTAWIIAKIVVILIPLLLHRVIDRLIGELHG